MWILPLIGYLGLILGFSFLTLSIASALYYLSELVEEHTVLSRSLLSNLIKTIIALHTLLLILDRTPPLLTLFSLFSHLLYSLNLRQFPLVQLSSPPFLLSCVAVLANHILWFRYFSTPRYPPGHPMSDSYVPGFKSDAEWDEEWRRGVPKFREVAGFFGVCVWLVPFALFVSLTAGENVLPSMNVNVGGTGGGFGGEKEKERRREGLAKKVVGGVREWVGGFWGGGRERRFE